MNTDIIHSLTSTFEAHAQQTEGGVEYWLARDIQYLLGYTKWDNFLNVVSKARTACEVSGNQALDHFADVGKTIQMPKSAEKEIPDILLTRYACYLIAQNGSHDAGGISSCSRGLSGATPPDQNPSESRTPAGVPANARHTIHPHQPLLPSDLRDETPRSNPRQRMAARTPRLSWRYREWTGCVLRGCRRRGRSCPPAGLPETDCLPFRFHAGAEKIFIQLAQGIEMPRLPLAGRIRRIHHQRFSADRSSRLHCQTGGTSSGEIFPRGVDRLSGKNGSHLRSEISRLIQPPMASRRDALSVSFDDPVVSLLPVVSLRSTTGYRLRSRWDHPDCPECPISDHFADANKMVPAGQSEWCEENVTKLLEA